MKIKKTKKKSPKKLIISLVIILLVALGIGAYFLISQKDEQNSQKDTKTTVSQQKKKDSSKNDKSEDSVDSTSPIEHEAEKEILPAYEGENPNNSQSLTGVINYAGVSNDTLMIRTTINQSLSSGTCNLSISNGSKTVTRSSQIAPNPSSSTCEGFDIPASELGSGNWTITIKVTSGDRSGELKGNTTI